MNTTKSKILVWDAPVRVSHWLMALSFFGAYLSAESERWRLLHVTLGYTLGGLVAFRVLWGLIGTRHARFGNFVRGPAALRSYLGGLLKGRPDPHVGHNPAGAVAIVLLLLLGVAVVLSGWGNYEQVGGERLEELHEVAANSMLAVVAVHVVGVLVASWLHHENLVRAMVTGYKRGVAGQAIPWSWRPLAGLLLAAVLGFWWWQWQDRPPVSAQSGPQSPTLSGSLSACA